MKRTPFKRKLTKPLKRRAIGLLRDGGCIFREDSEAGDCGGYRLDGELILQFDHLNSRTHGISFADSRLGVIACKRHHIFWKRQEPDIYMRLARKHIGAKRSALLDAVQADRRPYKLDLKLAIVGLKEELRKLEQSTW